MQFETVENPESLQITIPATRNSFIPLVIIGMALTWALLIMKVNGSQLQVDRNELIGVGFVLLCAMAFGQLIKKNILEYNVAKVIFICLVFGIVFILPYLSGNQYHSSDLSFWLENTATNWLIIVSILIYGLWSLWAKQVIIITDNELTATYDFFGFGSSQVYERNRIENLNVFSRPSFNKTSFIKYPNMISFDYQGRKCFIAGVGVNDTEAEQIIHKIETFRK